MVYCPKCGTLNDDSAEFCVKCGAALRTGTYESRRYERRRAENECFGLPNGGAIVGLVIGIIVILYGVLFLAQQEGWISASTNYLWIVVVIVIGVLLIAGAVYRMNRPRPSQI
ncbi:MAG TPA: zinc-ribbon domain-containing protein [Candidatus Acidoferrum sp.]|nr:zinc-ribbon domain-containing protein [Candidatus Acidoferrum sp.]